VFGSREIVKRELLKREKVEKVSISMVWNEEKLRRERYFSWAPHLFTIFSIQRRKELEMLMFLKIPFLSFS